MALDPKKFAALTSALAASIVVVGCTLESTQGDDDIEPGTGSSSSSGGSSSSGSSVDGGGSSSGNTDAGGSSSGGSDAGDTDAGACLGDQGAVPTCEERGEGCFASEERAYQCDGYAAIFRPAVAKATIDCLTISPSCEEGAPEENNCAAAAVAEACPVEDVTAFCDDLIADAQCTPGEEADGLHAECLAFVPALSPEGRVRLSACAGAEDACGFELHFCMDASYAASTLQPAPVD